MHEKIVEIAQKIEETKLHLGAKDLIVGDKKLNAQLWLTLANACLDDKMALLYGGIGANKTTLVEIFGAVFLNLSYEDAGDSVLHCDPELTEEKIVGFLNPRQWAQNMTTDKANEMEVLWTPWALSKWKVVNEINRLPKAKQNVILEILRKHEVEYAGQRKHIGKCRWFATMNPKLEGVYALDEALTDRISICIPAYRPSFVEQEQLFNRGEIDALVDELPKLTPEEYASLPEEVHKVSLKPEVRLAILHLTSDLSLCMRSESNDKMHLDKGNRPGSGLCQRGGNCHYFNNPEALCWYVSGGLSERARQDLVDYTKALSFLLGRDEADLDILRQIAPYVIWHRLEPNPSRYEAPPFYGAKRFQFIKAIVDKSIDKLASRREVSHILALALGNSDASEKAAQMLKEYDDPLAKMGFVLQLEQETDGKGLVILITDVYGTPRLPPSREAPVESDNIPSQKGVKAKTSALSKPNVTLEVVQVIGQEGLGDDKLLHIGGVAVDDQRVYVGNCSTGEVKAFDLQGNFLHRFGKGVLNFPTDIALGNGNVFVIDQDKLVLFTEAGKVLKEIPLTSPCGVAAYQQNIYVAEPSGVVFVMDGNGKMEKSFSVNSPQSIAFSGTLFISNGVEVLQLDTDGNVTASLSSFEKPQIVAAHREWLAVRDKAGIHCLKNGKLVVKTADIPHAGSLDINGKRIYVADAEAHQVKVLEVKGDVG